MICPLENNKYLKLKKRTYSSFGESTTLGEEKPSVFLHRLRNLVPGQVNDEILRSIFMEQLSENIRSIPVISEVKNLSKLAFQADLSNAQQVKVKRRAKKVRSTVSITTNLMIKLTNLYDHVHLVTKINT